MRSMKKLGAALVATGLLLAACGGDDDTATDTTEDAAPEPDTDDTDTDDAAPDEPDTTDTDDTDDAAPDEPDTTDAADDADDAVGDEVCTEDRIGGELTITSRGISRALDPAVSILSQGQTGSEGLPFYSVLMRYDIDNQEYVPHVAESLEPNDDFSVWTLTLRDGVEFGNGDPLDADAVVASFDYHLGPESTSRIRFGAAGVIESYEAISDDQVEITVRFGWAQFPSVLSSELGMIMNIAVVEERGEAFGTNPEGAGVGPYEIVEYSAPERIIFEAKDDWWGGPVCIQRLTYTFIPDMRANYDAFTQGEIDSLLIARDPVLIKRAHDEGIASRSQMYNGAFMTMPNVWDGHTADPRVRLAMAYAIDPDVVDARAWGGEGFGSKGLVHPESITLEPTEGIPYDPDMAQQILDEYKAETGWDGSIAGVAADTPQANQEAALAVASMLNAVGFDVETSLLGINDLIAQVIIDRNFELVLSWGFINSEAELYAGLRTWESTNPANQNGFAGEAYDAALVELREAATPEDYQAALFAVQDAINEEVPYIIYGGDLSTMVWNPAVKGGIPYLNQVYLLDQAYIEE